MDAILKPIVQDIQKIVSIAITIQGFIQDFQFGGGKMLCVESLV